MFIRHSRTARPTDAFERLPGPRVPMPALKPAAWTIGPCTTTRGAVGCVVDCMPSWLKPGWTIAFIAVHTTGKTSGRQPAITALAATLAAVTREPDGDITPAVWSGSIPAAASNHSMRARVG